MANVVAYLSKEEVLDKKYITDTSIAQALVSGELDLTDPIVMDHITQVGAYQAVYVTPVDDPNTPEDESIPEVAEEKAEEKDAEAAKEYNDQGGDHDDSNDITFSVDGETLVYAGSPKSKAKNALKSLSVSTPVYENGEELNLTNLKASDLAGRVLVTVLGAVIPVDVPATV